MPTPTGERGLQSLQQQLQSAAATPASTATQPAAAAQADEDALALALAAGLTTLTRGQNPDALPRALGRAAILWPAWARGITAWLEAMALMRQAGESRLGRRERAVHRATARQLAAWSRDDPRLEGVSELIEAEVLSRSGGREPASLAYEGACTTLGRSSFVVLQAIALECAAAHNLRTDMPIAAAALRREAAERYRAWGDVAAADRLLADQGPSKSKPLEAERSLSRDVLSRDLRAALVATQALAGESSSARVAERIIDTLRMLGGAGRVVLLIDKDGTPVVDVDTANTPERLPHQLIAYAMRSGEPVLLGDLARERFEDPYFAPQPTGSLLCVPWHQNPGSRGAVVLENTLTAHAFSAERVGIVRLLAATAASALVNASMYVDMEAIIARRVASMQKAMEQARSIHRTNSEMQMAGGFAHEMRNALAASRFALAAVVASHPNDAPGALEADTDLIQTCIASVERGEATPHQVGDVLATLQASQQTTTDSLEVILEGIDRGLHVAQAIMAFGRIAAATREEVPDSLEQLVYACILRHGARAPSNLTWVVQIDPKLTSRLSSEHLSAMLDHLIDNAIDAMTPGDIEHPRILVAANIVDDALFMLVKDNGCGMAEDVQDRACEPFFTTKGTLHLGLGLSVVRKITHLYGGQLRLTSSPQHGATVEMRFAP